jgi:hypothetical protein
MTTPYRGPATIGDLHADVDITNVDVPRWEGTVTNLHGRGRMPPETVVTLLDQPRPGWKARAQASKGADGVLHLDGIGDFRGPEGRVVESARRARWVPKLPRGT